MHFINLSFKSKEAHILNFSSCDTATLVMITMAMIFVVHNYWFDSRHYQKKKVVGLERGPLSLMSTTEELLDWKEAAPV
jgi:hypothetical protein